jgi:hypothetical protein
LSSFRTTRSIKSAPSTETSTPAKSAKFRAVAGPAAALVAAAATMGGWALATAAQPAATHRPVGLVRSLAPDLTAPHRPPAGASAAPASAAPATAAPVGNPGQPARLDAFFARAASADSPPAVSASSRRHKSRPTPRQTAIRLLHRFGWSKRQFRYLDLLWSRESSWNVRADNLYSGAYGIPQAVPGDKMASAGPRWRTCARTQIIWGLRYIKDRYGSPRAAWNHELATGWY